MRVAPPQLLRRAPCQPRAPDRPDLVAPYMRVLAAEGWTDVLTGNSLRALTPARFWPLRECLGTCGHRVDAFGDSVTMRSRAPRLASWLGEPSLVGSRLPAKLLDLRDTWCPNNGSSTPPRRVSCLTIAVPHHGAEPSAAMRPRFA